MAVSSLLLLATCPAFAQSATCRSIQAELATLDRGGDPRAAAQADRARVQVQRIAGYMASIGCDQRRIMIFGSSAPPECPSLRGQLQQAQAQLAAAEAAGDPRIAAQRRRDLQGALESYGCTGAAPQSRGLIDSLFGGSRQPDSGPRYNTPGTLEVRPNGEIPNGDDTFPSVDDAAPQRAGGGKAVCVRSCDGYYFPLDIAPGRAHDDGDALCQALCPGAKTNVYFMNLGGDIENAVSADGQNYTALPSALRYRQALQPSCACKAQTETWANLLKPAEGLLGGDNNGDITVTPEKSLEMSRPTPPGSAAVAPPKAAPPPPPKKRNAAKRQPTPEEQGLSVDSGDPNGFGRQLRVAPPVLRGQN